MHGFFPCQHCRHSAPAGEPSLPVVRFISACCRGRSACSRWLQSESGLWGIAWSTGLRCCACGDRAVVKTIWSGNYGRFLMVQRS